MNSVHKVKALDQISKLSFGLYALERSSAFLVEKMNIKELYNVISKNVCFYRMNNFKYGYLT